MPCVAAVHAMCVTLSLQQHSSGGHLQQEAGANSPHGRALGVHGQQEAAVGDVQ